LFWPRLHFVAACGRRRAAHQRVKLVGEMLAGGSPGVVARAAEPFTAWLALPLVG